MGHLASLERLVPHGRLRMRSLQWHLKSQWSPESDPPSLPVALPEEARRDLSWWMVRDHLLVGVRFGTPAPDLHLYSDASSSGWGAHLLDQNVSGMWSAQEKLLHINLLEMKALFLALQAFQEDVAGHHVTAMCDNSTVVAYVNKQGGTVSRPLCLLTSRLLRWTESFDVHLEARYLPGESNVLADVLSRRGQVVGTEWSLHPQVARALLRAWGNPSIDLFATCLNAKLPLYCSLVPDPQAVFEDAFRHPWDDLDLYAFPPFALVSRVIARVQQSSRVAMTGRTSLAREGVVRRLAASTDSTTPGSTLLGQAASAAPLQPVPSRRPRAEPSRVATLKRHYRKSGFSGRAARVLSGVLRESSSHLYQSRWKIFCGWCRGRSVAPVNASVPVVVDFLIHLRQDKGLSVSAVKGYCSALNSVLARCWLWIWPLLVKLRPCFVVLRDRSILLSCVHLRGTFLWSFRALRGLRMSLCGRVRSVFLPRKRSSYWPLPRLSVSVSSTLCRIESLIPGTGVRFPLLLSLVLWPRLRIPLPLLLGLRAFQYRP